MQPRDAAPQVILLPVRPAFIGFTLLAGLMVNLWPWSGWLLALKPDFVALVVLYWCIQQPRKVGFAAAWLIEKWLPQKGLVPKTIRHTP